jgi:hypothetical protein
MLPENHYTALGVARSPDKKLLHTGPREPNGARLSGLIDTGITAAADWSLYTWSGLRLAVGDAALSPGIIRFVMLAIVSAIYLNVAFSHTRLEEDRGVYDNICYLRQAHLFRTNGLLGGLDTNLPGARYVARKVEQSGLADQFATAAPCHGYMPITHHR